MEQNKKKMNQIRLRENSGTKGTSYMTYQGSNQSTRECGTFTGHLMQFLKEEYYMQK